MGSINKVVSLIVKMIHAKKIIWINMWLLTFTTKIGLYLHYLCVKSVSTIKTTTDHWQHNPKLWVPQKEKKDIFLSLIMRSTMANDNKFPLSSKSHRRTNKQPCLCIHAHVHSEKHTAAPQPHEQTTIMATLIYGDAWLRVCTNKHADNVPVVDMK